jgi:hypothetical protein
MVYAKSEVDRLRFHQRHETLLEQYRENKGSAKWRTSAKVRVDKDKDKKGDKDKDKKGNKDKDKKGKTSRPMPSPSKSGRGGRGMVPTAKSMRVQEQYDVLFEEAEGGRTERDIYVANVVGDYLDSVMPPEVWYWGVLVFNPLWYWYASSPLI